MERKRMKRRIVWDDKGVSEVIGTILTLTITVVLFSSIIMMVGYFPAPGSNVYVTFSGSVNPVEDDWSEGAYVNITNTGGVTMTSLYTLIYMKVDDTGYNLRVRGTYNAINYGLVGEAMEWGAGDMWSIKLASGEIKADSNVNIAIIDTNKDTVVWTHDIMGGEQSQSPIIVEGWVDSDLYTPRKDPIRFNQDFTFFVKIIDPNDNLDTSSVYVDMSSVGLDAAAHATDPDGDGIFTNVSTMGGYIKVGYYKFRVHASDTSGHAITTTVIVPVGQDIGNVVDLVIDEDDITFSKDDPKHGDIITISATIRNVGMAFTWTDIYFYDMNPDSEPIGHDEILISGVDSQTAFISWRAAPGGEHEIFVEAVVRAPKMDHDVTDNINSTSLTALPTILLVDDDNHVNDMSPGDTVSYMRAALESCSFDYDYLRVGNGMPGPGYDYGDYRLLNYDIVIWMLGYQNTSTFTDDDETNIKKFLTDTSDNRTNTGSMWVIGHGWLEDGDVDPLFIRDYLHVDGWTPIYNSTATMEGNSTHIITSEWSSAAGGTPFEIFERLEGEEKIYDITPTDDLTLNTKTEVMLNIGHCNVAANFENYDLDERIVLFPWEFSRIKEPAVQTQMAYKVIRWLGKINNTAGQDLAISSQTIDPTYVFYQQFVNISATIRNNGQDDLTNVAAVMYMDGVRLPESQEKSTIIPGGGGSWEVYYDWQANEVGIHIMKWKVDPDNIIIETNEDNNEVSDYLSTGQLIVEFRILVVDDDDSPNNGGAQFDEAGVVKDILNDEEMLDDLGYVYEEFDVTAASGGNGPDSDLLAEYSAVVWVTGNASEASALTSVDEANIELYLTNNTGRLWLIGANCLGASVTPGFEGDILGIQNITVNQSLPAVLNGVRDDPITHGMEIQTYEGNGSDTIRPIADPGASGILNCTGLGIDQFYGVRYDSGISVSVVMTMSLMNIWGNDTGYIEGTDARSELTYMVFHWFGKPDLRTELRTTRMDFTISDAHPVLGHAYVLQATVHNVGKDTANALIRFMDGNTQIGSDSITVDPDDTTTAEVIWQPLFAGARELAVMVDPFWPISEVPEVFERFNNNITIPTYVYFFWDDMEDVEESYNKWDHYSTVININGENPIDYFTASADLDVDIISDWNETESYGVDEVTDVYHTHDTSYFMEEPIGPFGAPADILISFALDDSKSMQDRTAAGGDSWLDVAKDASKLLLEQLSDNSVCVSIWDFNGNNERRWAGPSVAEFGREPTDDGAQENIKRAPVRLGDTYISTINGSSIDGRQKIRDEIEAMSNPPGQTILWDAVGEAYLDNKWWEPSYPDHVPAVVVLSDGMDLQASDGSSLTDNTANNKVEGGSDHWAPWNANDGVERHYDIHYGKYTYDWQNPAGQEKWLEALAQGSMDRDRYGLLNSDMLIYTVGLGVEHHDDPETPDVMEVWQPVINTWPGTTVADSVNAVCDHTTLPPVPTLESGTLEYNLWRIANTSRYGDTFGQYFYAEDADDLGDIFTYMGQIIGATGFNQTRAIDDANVDKRAVTETFSLEGIEEAKLSFWHRYNLLQGGNGGFLQVAYKDDDVDGDGDGDPTNDWDYRYIIPPGEYSGGLYYDYDWYDDFGTLIKWCWNGISDRGSFDWDYVDVEIAQFVPTDYRDEVRIAFNYTQLGGGRGQGWWLDDVKLVVSRYDSEVIDAADKDIWGLVNMTASGNISHSGDHCWSNVDPVTGHMKPGIDNSLQTMPVDLTHAQNAYLSAYLKFNINTADGMPPDGFRIEISRDGGTYWTAINQGSRASWGVSGMEDDASDGTPGDGKSYTGINETDNWVEVDSLTRVNIDLTNWRGYQVLLRFRMVTNSHPAYDHYEDYDALGGFHVDDVVIWGESISV